MAKITVTNANDFSVQVPLIGRDGAVSTVNANGTLELPADVIEWYSALQVKQYYEALAIEGLTFVYDGEASTKPDVEFLILVDGSAASGKTVAIGEITGTTGADGTCTLKDVPIGSATATVNTSEATVTFDVKAGNNKVVISYTA